MSASRGLEPTSVARMLRVVLPFPVQLLRMSPV